MKKILLMCMLLVLSIRVSAQYTTEGRVIDSYGNPVSGAKVQGKGMASSTETAIDGSFTLETIAPVKSLQVTAFGKAPRIKKRVDGQNKIKLDDLNWYNEKQDYNRWFVMAQCGLLSKDSKDVPFGLMFGMVKKWGFYVKGMYSGLPETHGSLDYHGEVDFQNRTGNIKSGFLSMTAGGVARLRGPLYAYVGGGYALRKVAIETASGKWLNLGEGWYNWDSLDNARSIENAIAVDAGLMMNCKYVTLNIGCTSLFDTDDDRFMNTVHFGIGYTF